MLLLTEALPATSPELGTEASGQTHLGMNPTPPPATEWACSEVISFLSVSVPSHTHTLRTQARPTWGP